MSANVAIWPYYLQSLKIKIAKRNHFESKRTEKQLIWHIPLLTFVSAFG
jgi:hypothetical protein